MLCSLARLRVHLDLIKLFHSRWHTGLVDLPLPLPAVLWVHQISDLVAMVVKLLPGVRQARFESAQFRFVLFVKIGGIWCEQGQMIPHLLKRHYTWKHHVLPTSAARHILPATPALLLIVLTNIAYTSYDLHICAIQEVLVGLLLKIR